MEQYAVQHRTNETPSKQYFKQTQLKDIIMEYPFSKKNAKQSDIDKGEHFAMLCISPETDKVRRDGTTDGLLRFRTRTIEPRPHTKVVTTAGCEAPFHHRRTVHRSLPGMSKFTTYLPRHERRLTCPAIGDHIKTDSVPCCPDTGITFSRSEQEIRRDRSKSDGRASWTARTVRRWRI